jgi:glycosyltransferase involved in cell wall biosynthesis
LTIHIVQPVLPSYRLAFFRQLRSDLSQRNATLRIYGSPHDHRHSASVAPAGFEAKLDCPMSVHLGGRVFWQWKLDVPLAPGDILIINGNPRFLSNYPLWARAKLLGVPVVWWGHGWSGGSFGTRSKLRQWLMRFADAVVLYTDKERDDYIALGFAPDQTFALNNGLDVQSVDRAIARWDPARLQEFRKTNGLGSHAHWCIFPGRLSDKSGIELLIESLPTVRNDVGLIILGDGPLAGLTRERAQQLGVLSRIVWVGQEFEEDAIAPWMLSASVLVYPGAVGLSLIHGFAYGLAAVVHGDRHRQMPEFSAFEDHGNGLSFEYGSANSLATTINSIVADRPRAEAMSRKAIELVHRTFNVEDMSRRFLTVIDWLDSRAKKHH